MQWPDFFPDECPPDNSESATGIVFRLISGNKPKEKDFLSYRELYPSKKFKLPECRVCSLSVYKLADDIERLKRRVPATRKKKLSKGSLSSKYGKIKHTPTQGDSHHSWWRTENSQPWLRFEVI